MEKTWPMVKGPPCRLLQKRSGVANGANLAPAPWLEYNPHNNAYCQRGHHHPENGKGDFVKVQTGTDKGYGEHNHHKRKQYGFYGFLFHKGRKVVPQGDILKETPQK